LHLSRNSAKRQNRFIQRIPRPVGIALRPQERKKPVARNAGLSRNRQDSQDC
jgi:hypothetical protein